MCGGTHSGAAAKAIDIGVSYKTIVAAATSTLYGVQWSNSGYGNLVKLKDTSPNGYIAYYAHLNWFAIDPNVPVIPQGGGIGQSGAIGAPGSPHLHFHVQTTSNSPISLTGMTNLTLTGNYPNCSKATCNEIKALPNQECECGRVN